MHTLTDMRWAVYRQLIMFVFCSIFRLNWFFLIFRTIGVEYGARRLWWYHVSELRNRGSHACKRKEEGTLSFVVTASILSHWFFAFRQIANTPAVFASCPAPQLLEFSLSPSISNALSSARQVRCWDYLDISFMSTECVVLLNVCIFSWLDRVDLVAPFNSRFCLQL